MQHDLTHLTGSVHVSANKNDLFDVLASHVLDRALKAVQARGVFHIALSGGSTPEPFYMGLVIDPRFRGMPWDHTHIWVVDERRVPDDDDRYNYKMMRESLVDHLPIKSRQAHPMPVLADDPAGAYEADLREAVPGGRLDFVLLGMGDDAHTASLFPHSKAIDESMRWVAVNDGDNVTPPDRVTMTYPLLNSARYVAVLVTGEKKLATLQRVNDQLRDTGPDPTALPITGIAPTSDNGDDALTWYLDADAAGADTSPQQIELA